MLRHRVIAFSGFLLLILNPYVLEYFALSRGYGLALGLMAGALFFFIRLLTEDDAHCALRHAWRSWLFAIASTVANLSLLNACLVFLGAGFIALVVRTRRAAPTTSTTLRHARPIRPPVRHLVLLTTVAMVLTVLVLSQDPGIVGRLYEPILVRMDGPARLDDIRVSQVNVRFEALALTRRDATWKRRDPADAMFLRIEMPIEEAASLRGIDVRIGNRDFATAPDDHTWTSHDDGGVRVFESRPLLSLARTRIPAFREVINWGGDRRYVAALGELAAIAVGGWALLAACLMLASQFAIRAAVGDADQWRRLVFAILILAAVAGGPLYVVAQNGELSYGGTTGLVADTFSSLVNASFHGRAYVANQTPLLLDALGMLMLVLACALAAYYFRARPRRAATGLWVLALFALVALEPIVEHAILQTPYPEHRTALFFLPLFVTFVFFALDALADFGARTRTLISATTLMVAMLAAGHMALTSNASSALDWPYDAATPAMITDLDRIISKQQSASLPAVLEVYWQYWPVAEVYARRLAPTRLVVVTRPAEQATGYQYVREREIEPGAVVLARYPVSDGVLARTTPEQRRGIDLNHH
jgi:hypothetical protein